MKIIVTGASGLIGSALLQSLVGRNHKVTRLVRDETKTAALDDGTQTARWNLAAGTIDAVQLEGHDAVVHLAGESVAEGRWTPDKKARIRDSRVRGTRLLAGTLARLSERPRTFISASAVGYYGSQAGAQVMREDSPAGHDFLAEVSREWEAAAQPAAAAGMRVVHLRIGIVLSPEGGALKKLLTPFKLGVGGEVGSGEQYMSWIALDDVVGAINHALLIEDLSGAVNTVAPNPVTNREFTKTLGEVLGRPTVLSVPAFAARFAFGEMADAILLGGARVAPTKLVATNYKFQFSTLEAALRHLLKEQK